MRLVVMVIAGGLVGACAAPEPNDIPRQAAELAGRAAGAAQRCVLIRNSDAMRVSATDRHTLVYGSGNTIFANRLGPGCGFGPNDILVTEPMGAYYCRGDIVRSVDQLSGMPGPSCVLGEFVPYTRG